VTPQVSEEVPLTPQYEAPSRPFSFAGVPELSLETPEEVIQLAKDDKEFSNLLQSNLDPLFETFNEDEKMRLTASPVAFMSNMTEDDFTKFGDQANQAIWKTVQEYDNRRMEQAYAVVQFGREFMGSGLTPEEKKVQELTEFMAEAAKEPTGTADFISATTLRPDVDPILLEQIRLMGQGLREEFAGLNLPTELQEAAATEVGYKMIPQILNESEDWTGYALSEYGLKGPDGTPIAVGTLAHSMAVSQLTEMENKSRSDYFTNVVSGGMPVPKGTTPDLLLAVAYAPYEYQSEVVPSMYTKSVKIAYPELSGVPDVVLWAFLNSPTFRDASLDPRKVDQELLASRGMDLIFGMESEESRYKATLDKFGLTEKAGIDIIKLLHDPLFSSPPFPDADIDLAKGGGGLSDLMQVVTKTVGTGAEYLSGGFLGILGLTAKAAVWSSTAVTSGDPEQAAKDIRHAITNPTDTILPTLVSASNSGHLITDPMAAAFSALGAPSRYIEEGFAPHLVDKFSNQPLLDDIKSGLADESWNNLSYSWLGDQDAQRYIHERLEEDPYQDQLILQMEVMNLDKEILFGTIGDPLNFGGIFLAKGLGIVGTRASISRMLAKVTAEGGTPIEVLEAVSKIPGIPRPLKSAMVRMASGERVSPTWLAIIDEMDPRNLFRGIIRPAGIVTGESGLLELGVGKWKMRNWSNWFLGNKFKPMEHASYTRAGGELATGLAAVSEKIPGARFFKNQLNAWKRETQVMQSVAGGLINFNDPASANRFIRALTAAKTPVEATDVIVNQFRMSPYMTEDLWRVWDVVSDPRFGEMLEMKGLFKSLNPTLKLSDTAARSMGELGRRKIVNKLDWQEAFAQELGRASRQVLSPRYNIEILADGTYNVPINLRVQRMAIGALAPLVLMSPRYLIVNGANNLFMQGIVSGYLPGFKAGDYLRYMEFGAEPIGGFVSPEIVAGLQGLTPGKRGGVAGGSFIGQAAAGVERTCREMGIARETKMIYDAYRTEIALDFGRRITSSGLSPDDAARWAARYQEDPVAFRNEFPKYMSGEEIGPIPATHLGPKPPAGYPNPIDQQLATAFTRTLQNVLAGEPGAYDKAYIATGTSVDWLLNKSGLVTEPVKTYTTSLGEVEISAMLRNYVDDIEKLVDAGIDFNTAAVSIGNIASSRAAGTRFISENFAILRRAEEILHEKFPGVEIPDFSKKLATNLRKVNRGKKNLNDMVVGAIADPGKFDDYLTTMGTITDTMRTDALTHINRTYLEFTNWIDEFAPVGSANRKALKGMWSELKLTPFKDLQSTVPDGLRALFLNPGDEIAATYAVPSVLYDTAWMRQTLKNAQKMVREGTVPAAVAPEAGIKIRAALQSDLDDLVRKDSLVRREAFEGGRSITNIAMHDYMVQGQWDYWLRWFAPFQFWWTRSLSKMPLYMADRPGLWATFNRIIQSTGERGGFWWVTDEQLKENPEVGEALIRYRHKIGLPFSVNVPGMGEAQPYVNPWNWLPLSPMMRWQQDDQMGTNVGKLANMVDGYGFGMTPLLEEAMIGMGWYGEEAKRNQGLFLTNFIPAQVAEIAFKGFSGGKLIPWSTPQDFYGARLALLNDYSNDTDMTDQDFMDALAEIDKYEGQFMFGIPSFNSKFAREAWVEASNYRTLKQGLSLGTSLNVSLKFEGETNSRAAFKRMEKKIQDLRLRLGSGAIGRREYGDLLEDAFASEPMGKVYYYFRGDPDVNAGREDYYSTDEEIKKNFFSEVRGLAPGDPKIDTASSKAYEDRQAALQETLEQYNITEDQLFGTSMRWWEQTYPRILKDIVGGQATPEDLEEAAKVITWSQDLLAVQAGNFLQYGTPIETPEEVGKAMALAYWGMDEETFRVAGDIEWGDFFDTQEQLVTNMPPGVQDQILKFIRDPDKVPPEKAIQDVYNRRVLSPYYDARNAAVEGIEDPAEVQAAIDKFDKEYAMPTTEEFVQWVLDDYNTAYWLNDILPHVYTKEQIENAMVGLDHPAKHQAFSWENKMEVLKADPTKTFRAPSGVTVDQFNVGLFQKELDQRDQYIVFKEMEQRGEAVNMRDHAYPYDGQFFSKGQKATEDYQIVAKLINERDSILRIAPRLADGSIDPAWLGLRREDGMTWAGKLTKLDSDIAKYTEVLGADTEAALGVGGGTGTAFTGPTPGIAQVSKVAPVTYKTLTDFYVMGGRDFLGDLSKLWQGQKTISENDMVPLISLYNNFSFGATSFDQWINVTLPSIFNAQSLEMLVLQETSALGNLQKWWAGKTALTPDTQANLYEIFQLTHPAGGDFVAWVTKELKDQFTSRGKEVFDWLGGTSWLPHYEVAWGGGEMSSDAREFAIDLYSKMPMGADTFTEWMYETLPRSLGQQVVKATTDPQTDTLYGILTSGGDALWDDIINHVKLGEPLSPTAEKTLWTLYSQFSGNANSFTDWLSTTIPNLVKTSPARVIGLVGVADLENLVDFWAGYNTLKPQVNERLYKMWALIGSTEDYEKWVKETLLKDYQKNQVQIFLDLGGSAMVDDLRAYWEKGAPLAKQVMDNLDELWQRTPMGSESTEDWIENILPAEFGKFSGVQIAKLDAWSRFMALGGKGIMGSLVKYWYQGIKQPTNDYDKLKKIYAQMPLGAETVTEWRNETLLSLYEGQGSRAGSGTRVTWTNFTFMASKVLGRDYKPIMSELVRSFQRGKRPSGNVIKAVNRVLKLGIFTKQWGNTNEFLDILYAAWSNTRG
jgi:hypothetical protein